MNWLPLWAPLPETDHKFGKCDYISAFRISSKGNNRSISVFRKPPVFGISKAVRLRYFENRPSSAYRRQSAFRISKAASREDHKAGKTIGPKNLFTLIYLRISDAAGLGRLHPKYFFLTRHKSLTKGRWQVRKRICSGHWQGVFRSVTGGKSEFKKRTQSGLSRVPEVLQ